MEGMTVGIAAAAANPAGSPFLSFLGGFSFASLGGFSFATRGGFSFFALGGRPFLPGGASAAGGASA
jgi:hypothetical protein